jgi:hypothetical protein
MPIIQWSNGKVDSAGTWNALETLVREDQYRPFDKAQFRVEMFKRALLWSGVEIDVSANAHQFFTELQWAKLIKILKEGN